MCGRFTQFNKTRLRARLHMKETELHFPPRYNIAPSQPVFAARMGTEGLEPAMLRWGLVPSWAKDAKIAYQTINARCETIATKPAFRSAFKKRRCLIPADGFYEWRTEGKKKIPQFIHLKSGDALLFAGLWEEWTPPGGEAVETFTIVTTAANDKLRELHERMPVILSDDLAVKWLDTGRTDLEDVFAPLPTDLIDFHEVDPKVNKPANDEPGLIEPVEAVPGGSLFD